MKRKTSTVPTRIWTFGCLLPTSGYETIVEQLSRATRYYNNLIDIQKARRARIRAAEAASSPLSALAAHADRLESDLAAVRLAIKSARAAARGSAAAVVAPQAARAKDLASALKAARQALRDARMKLRDDATVKTETEAANLEASARRRRARSRCGVYSGTYLLVEAAAQQAGAMPLYDFRGEPQDPQHREYDGTGRLGVQFVADLGLDKNGQQKAGKESRIPTASLLFTANTLCQIGSAEKRTTLRFRVASDAAHKPVWAELPLVLHRPLPADAVVKWAWLRRTRDTRTGGVPTAEHRSAQGSTWRYELQLSLESKMFETMALSEGRGTVAVDVGYRTRGDDSMRVAWCVDDQGRSWEVRLPESVQRRSGQTPEQKERTASDWRRQPRDPIPRTVLGRLHHADSLRSIRDQAFNEARDALQLHLKMSTEGPDWLRQATRHLGQWRSSARLAELVHDVWYHRRYPGDETIWTVMKAWEKQNRHLYQWETNQRRSALAWRLDFYRQLSADLAKRYSVIVLEDIDLRKFAVRSTPERADEDQPQAVRSRRHWAAISELRGCFTAALQKHGSRIEKSKEATVDSTQECHLCGCRDPWNAAPSIEHTCSGCGETWDQDENAARNLLARYRASSGSVPPPSPSPLADGSTDGKTNDVSGPGSAPDLRGRGSLAGPSLSA